VSVGGLLALDQVLRKHWSCLTTFWDFDRPVEEGVPRQSRDREISLILRACGPSKGFTRVYVTGYGMSTHGFTHA
jgi:hypothetical protein